MDSQRINQRHTGQKSGATVGRRGAASEGLRPGEVPDGRAPTDASPAVEPGAGPLSSIRASGVLRRLYTALAPLYDRLVPLISSEARSLGVSWLDLRDGERILDVGCGPGRALERLATATPTGWTIGLDATPAMVTRARARLATLPHARYRVRRADAQDLPYPDDAFDAVFSSYLVDVLPRPAMGPVLREMRRVLRPDGRLVLVVLVPPVRPVEQGWAALARSAPLLLGGARPVRPRLLLDRAGFSMRRAASRTQWGLRSGILRARPA